MFGVAVAVPPAAQQAKQAANIKKRASETHCSKQLPGLRTYVGCFCGRPSRCAVPVLIGGATVVAADWKPSEEAQGPGWLPSLLVFGGPPGCWYRGGVVSRGVARSGRAEGKSLGRCDRLPGGYFSDRGV